MTLQIKQTVLDTSLVGLKNIFTVLVVVMAVPGHVFDQVAGRSALTGGEHRRVILRLGDAVVGTRQRRIGNVTATILPVFRK